MENGWKLKNTYLTLPERFYRETLPGQVPSPELVVLNTRLAKDLGLSKEYLSSQEGVDILAGNKIPGGSRPISQAYAGHQFGSFTMLGDGRAVVLGEQKTLSGEYRDIQLKGSGRTVFSRGGDGKATLGPMLREYIISEALYGLGVPSTQSLAVVKTGERIQRYGWEDGAILTRVAKSHIRVGTFQYAAAFGSLEELRALADYTIARDQQKEEILEGENPYQALLSAVVERQGTLMAQWQLIGMIHGVMNTDNMAISGESIDFGPVAFMDFFDPDTVFSSIDTYKRYAYGNQPAIGLWNLTRFAETLLPLLNPEEQKAVALAQEALTRYEGIYKEVYRKGMRAKLGLEKAEEEDDALAEELLLFMKENHLDFTGTFLDITFQRWDKDAYQKEGFRRWRLRWQERSHREDRSLEERRERMMEANPAIIPRNYGVEEALQAAGQGNYDKLKNLLEALRDPYTHSKEQEEIQRSWRLSIPGEYRTFCGT